MYTRCTNTVGGAPTCSDIDECATSNGGCSALVVCTNLAPGFQCGSCPMGFVDDGAGGCEDLNECATDNGGCDGLTTCFNEVGSRSCGDCPTGYIGTGELGCSDVDECATNNGDCGDAAQWRCENQLGGPPQCDEIDPTSGLCGTALEPVAGGPMGAWSTDLGAQFFDANGDGHVDLFIRSADGQNRLYMGDGSGGWSEEAAARGVQEPDSIGWRPNTVGDFDGDGDVDIILMRDTRVWTTDNLLLVNDGTGHFTDAASTWGIITPDRQASAAILTDYDLDGDLDMLMSTEWNTAVLFRNDGAPPFVSANAEFPTHLQGSGVLVFDLTSAARPDVVLDSHLYPRFLVHSGTAYANEAAARGIVASANTVKTYTVVDLDGDGNLDIYAIRQTVADVVYLSNGDGTYTSTEAAGFGLPDAAFNIPPLWADYDRDGDMDVYFSQRGLYRNDGGTFSEVTAAAGLAPAGSIATWGDYDGDGILDLYAQPNANPGPAPALYHGVEIASEGCRSPGVVRIEPVTDNDGDATDAITSDDRLALNAQVLIDLDGDGDFAGSTSPGDRVVIYVVGHASAGYTTNQHGPVVAGVGAATSVDVRVRFEDGSVVTVSDVAPGATVVVRDE
ncbi:MAG: VCBS repeat-containing protein [Sandaracinaceae bacterium]|nr:VCBS repeat-containing protein [Sandaracinaceae bacterium]